MFLGQQDYTYTLSSSALVYTPMPPVPPKPTPTPALFASGVNFNWNQANFTNSEAYFAIGGFHFNQSGTGQASSVMQSGYVSFSNGTSSRSSVFTDEQLAAFNNGSQLLISTYGWTIRGLHMRGNIYGYPSSLSFSVPVYGHVDTSWNFAANIYVNGSDYYFIKSSHTSTSDPVYTTYSQPTSGRSSVTIGMRVPPWKLTY